MKKRRISRRELIDTNYGRKCGWYVEFDGHKLARLIDPIGEYDSHFYHSYLIEPLTRDPAMLSLLYSADFWLAGAVGYRNCEFEEWTPDGFAGGDAANQVAETGRISMRGLYLCTFWRKLTVRAPYRVGIR